LIQSRSIISPFIIFSNEHAIDCVSFSDRRKRSKTNASKQLSCTSICVKEVLCSDQTATHARLSEGYSVLLFHPEPSSAFSKN
jgi:hypothetical protein